MWENGIAILSQLPFDSTIVKTRNISFFHSIGAERERKRERESKLILTKTTELRSL